MGERSLTVLPARNVGQGRALMLTGMGGVAEPADAT
jgi:hypothetical protein